MTYRLSLDLGTNSIGWAQLSLNEALRPTDLLDGGVHIFDQGRHPKSLASRAADRRVARGMRRNRDRGKLRTKDLVKTLIAHGLMPAKRADRKALEVIEPLSLRAAALTRRLEPFELGRAIFHLHQRRGFQSNRKSDGGESGKISDATQALHTRLKEEGFESYGAFLNARRLAGKSTRITLSADGKAYEFYPTRALIAAELDLLFARQRDFGLVEANAQAQAAICTIFTRQRKLREPLVGKCLFEPAEDRAARVLPTAQHARIWAEVLNLRILDARQHVRDLSEAEQDKLIAQLKIKPQLEFKKIHTLLDLSEGDTFNLKSAKRTKLLGDQAAAKLRPAFKKHGGPDWHALPLNTQDAVIEKIIGYEEDEVVEAWFRTEFGFTDEAAQAIANTVLSPARSNLSAKAWGKLLEVYETERLPYDEAVKAAGYGHHSDRRTGEVYDTLPYYGAAMPHAVSPGTGKETEHDEAKRYGRFPNPTVHIVLNRIRKLVNALVERDGKPAQIIIESGRELPLSPDARRQLEREQRDNTQKNDKRAEFIRGLGQQVTTEALLRLALWKELAPDYRCVFSGQKISQADALSHKFEVEHILPYSRTLDNGRGNKTLCAVEVNRKKRNQTPFEAFGDTPAYEPMMERVGTLPWNKRWRFGPIAMKRFEEKEGWLARQLTDTQYIARLAVEYLTPICANFDGQNMPCWASPGRLTAAVRHTLGLNEVLGKRGKKNRDDHRHHFVDAVVLGLMDRGFLQDVARVARRADDKADQDAQIANIIESALGSIKAPLRSAVEARARTLVIAHRPDHSKGGSLLKETAYGFTNKAAPELTYDPKDKSQYNVSLRVPFPGDKFKKPEHLSAILSAKTHAKIYALVMPRLETGEPFAEACAAAAKTLGIKKVRIGLRETVEGIEVDGALTKGYASGGNWAYDIYQCPYQKKVGSEIINLREANQLGFSPKWTQTHPEAKRLFRLFSGDMIEIDDPRKGKEGRAIFRIQKMSEGIITLCEPQEANADARNSTSNPLFFAKAPGVLVSLNLRKLYVSIIGELIG